MSNNDAKEKLKKEALYEVSESEKDERIIINSSENDNSNIIKNKTKKEKKYIPKKNYLNESLNSENYFSSSNQKRYNQEGIKKYQKKIEELNNEIDGLKKELKLEKRDRYDKEEELTNLKYLKNKEEKKYEIELKEVKEKNDFFEEQNNKLLADIQNMKSKLDEYSSKIREYDELYQKCKKLEKEKRKLDEEKKLLQEQYKESKNIKSETEKNYDNLILENQILKQNNDTLKKNILESDSKLNNQAEKIAELEKDLRDMNKRNQNYIEKLTEKNLSLDNSYKDKVAKELNDMRNRYENDIFLLKKQYDELNEKKTSYLKEERDEYRSKYSRAEALLKEKEESLNMIQSQLRDLNTKSNAEISNLKLQLNIKIEELNSKSAIYEEQKSSLALYKNDNDALKEKNDLLKSEIIKLEAEFKTKIAQYDIELRTAKEKLKLYDEVENKLDNVINLAPGNDELELVEIIKDTPSSNKRRISQNLTLASKVKMLSDENEKLKIINDKLNKDIYDLNDQCNIYKNIIDNVKQPNSYLISNLKDREIEVRRLQQELLNKEEEMNNLKNECNSYIDTINKMKNDMQKMFNDRKKIDDLQNMLNDFIQKEKKGKNNFNDIDNMNNYLNNFNNNLNGTNLSLNHYSTQQGFYHTASSGFRQQKPERDIEVERNNKKIATPNWFIKLNNKKKKNLK